MLMAMSSNPGCAFSLPPCAAIGRVYGDHHVPPHTLALARSINAQQALQAINQKEWQSLAYRPRRRLAARRKWPRGTLQLQQSVDGSGPAGHREGEASPRQQHQQDQQQQRQHVEERVLVSPPATASSSTSAGGEDEGLVILDDPFEELEGGRRRHPCVVHNTLAAGPTPYNDGWEWQKQVSGSTASIGIRI